MKKLLLVAMVCIACKINAQVIGGGLIGEISYAPRTHLFIAAEGKERVLKERSEIEMNTAFSLVGSYIFQKKHLHPFVGAGLEYNLSESAFSFLLLAGIENHSFSTGLKLLIGENEVGAEFSGVMFPWKHHHLGVGFFIEAIPLIHPTYTGGIKLCLRLEKDWVPYQPSMKRENCLIFFGQFFYILEQNNSNLDPLTYEAIPL